jgi:hypothetical protein
MFAPRAEITSQPDDPARLAAVREEWWVWYALEWSRTDPEAKPLREHQLARLSKPARRVRKSRFLHHESTLRKPTVTRCGNQVHKGPLFLWIDASKVAVRYDR